MQIATTAELRKAWFRIGRAALKNADLSTHRLFGLVSGQIPPRLKRLGSAVSRKPWPSASSIIADHGSSQYRVLHCTAPLDSFICSGVSWPSVGMLADIFRVTISIVTPENCRRLTAILQSRTSLEMKSGSASNPDMKRAAAGNVIVAAESVMLKKRLAE